MGWGWVDISQEGRVGRCVGGSREVGGWGVKYKPNRWGCRVGNRDAFSRIEKYKK